MKCLVIKSCELSCCLSTKLFVFEGVTSPGDGDIVTDTNTDITARL